MWKIRAAIAVLFTLAALMVAGAWIYSYRSDWSVKRTVMWRDPAFDGKQWKVEKRGDTYTHVLQSTLGYRSQVDYFSLYAGRVYWNQETGSVGLTVTPKLVRPSWQVGHKALGLRDWTFAIACTATGWNALGFEYYRRDRGGSICNAVLYVPFWFLFMACVGSAAIFSLLAARDRRRVRRAASGCCPACGYDLRGGHDRCPECGTPPGLAMDVPKSVSPWVRWLGTGALAGCLLLELVLATLWAYSHFRPLSYVRGTSQDTGRTTVAPYIVRNPSPPPKYKTLAPRKQPIWSGRVDTAELWDGRLNWQRKRDATIAAEGRPLELSYSRFMMKRQFREESWDYGIGPVPAGWRTLGLQYSGYDSKSEFGPMSNREFRVPLLLPVLLLAIWPMRRGSKALLRRWRRRLRASPQSARNHRSTLGGADRAAEAPAERRMSPDPVP